MATSPPPEREPRKNVTPPPSGSSFDVIVIGGGTIGLSAAYYASARGLKTLLLEQFELGNPWASSGGASRMFRIMYAPAYMAQLAEVALAMWKEIETASGQQILQMQPLIFYGVAENVLEGNIDQMRQVLTSLGVPHSWYGNGNALMQQYQVLQNVPANYVGLVQANSAVIRAETSISAFHSLATGAGATVLTNQPAKVPMILPKVPYQVSCAAGTYSARSLILCPGAWTNSVLEPFRIQLDLKIWQMTVGYYQANVGAYAYPLWYEFGETPETQYYGFPAEEVPGFLKVSTEFTKDIFPCPSKCTYEPDPQILHGIGAFLKQRFKGIGPTYKDAATCLYTMSHDFEMILDRLPGYPNVAIFTGASGRGFKFTPLCGRILVDLATAGKTYYDISPFSITRNGVIKT